MTKKIPIPARVRSTVVSLLTQLHRTPRHTVDVPPHEEHFLLLAQELDGYVATDVLDDFRREISYGEYGVGLENLCERLREFDARLPAAILDEIAWLARLMQLPDDR